MNVSHAAPVQRTVRTGTHRVNLLSERAPRRASFPSLDTQEGDAGIEGAAPLRTFPRRLRRPRRRGRRPLLPERTLPPADVVPAPVLVADGAQHPGRREAHPLVEAYARRPGCCA